MILTLSGMPGSGKSTVAKLLAKRLRLKHYSIGDLRGRMAMEKGMTIDELNRVGEKEAWTDADADAYQRKLGKNEDNFIMDGRLSWHFIPHSLKIFLDVDEQVGAKRIFGMGKRPDEREYNSPADALRETKKRIASDKKRYRKYYGIDPYLKKHYDLWIDTTRIPSAKVAERIVEWVKKEMQGNVLRQTFGSLKGKWKIDAQAFKDELRKEQSMRDKKLERLFRKKYH